MGNSRKIILIAPSYNDTYAKYKTEKTQIVDSLETLEELNKKYNYSSDSIVELKPFFIKCFADLSTFDIIQHPNCNLALLIFKDVHEFEYQGYAKFAKSTDDLRQGKHLCRLGYPSRNFNDYYLNEDLDQIGWKFNADISRPIVPIEGTVTGLVNEGGRENIGIEMSTPGPLGYEGSPLFDSNGTIYGIHLTNRLIQNDTAAQIEYFNKPDGLVGECLNAYIITEFLSQNNVKFYEVDNGKLIVNDENPSLNTKPTYSFPINMVPVAFIDGEGQGGMNLYSTQVIVGDEIVFDNQTPMQLTIGEVDAESRIIRGSALVKFSTEGDNKMSIKEDGIARVRHLEENIPYKLEVKHKKQRSNNWIVKAKIKTQEREPLDYFDLVIRRRSGTQIEGVRDPHITFFPDGSGKFIRYDMNKSFQINTIKNNEYLDSLILPQETLIEAEEFQIKIEYEFKNDTLSIINIEVIDK